MKRLSKYIVSAILLVFFTACGARNLYSNDAEISYVFEPTPILDGDMSEVLKEFHSIDLNPKPYGGHDPISEKYHISDQNSETVIILINKSVLQISQYPAKKPGDRHLIETRTLQIKQVVERLIESGHWKVSGSSE